MKRERNMISQRELVALLAMMVGTVAFSIDGMLPGLPVIAAELTPQSPKNAQGVLVAFMLGMGLGTFFVGPISDAVGRRPVIFIGLSFFSVMGCVAYLSHSLEVICLARFFQGLGAAAPRIVAQAVIRDLYEGRKMAQLISFVMVIFSLTPAIAPLLGEQIIHLTGWRGIFLAFALFGILQLIWFGTRLKETHPIEKRRQFKRHQIIPSLREMWSIQQVRTSILAQSFCYGLLFSSIVLIQPIFDQAFGRAESFAKWFAAIAVMGALANFLNARLVIRYGMRTMVLAGLGIQLALSLTALLYFMLIPHAAPSAFWVYLFWQFSVFFQVGFTLGNLNALALQPLSHMAGFGASVTGGVSTVLAASMASLVNLFFDQSPMSLIAGCVLMICAGLVILTLGHERETYDEEPSRSPRESDS